MSEEDWLHKAEYNIRQNEMKIEELEKKIDKNWNLNQELAQEIMPNQIERVEDRLQKCGVIWDFRLDELNGFITELKKSYQNNRALNDKSFQHIYRQVTELKEQVNKILDLGIDQSEQLVRNTKWITELEKRVSIAETYELHKRVSEIEDQSNIHARLLQQYIKRLDGEKEDADE